MIQDYAWIKSGMIYSFVENVDRFVILVIQFLSYILSFNFNKDKKK